MFDLEKAYDVWRIKSLRQTFTKNIIWLLFIAYICQFIRINIIIFNSFLIAFNMWIVHYYLNIVHSV